MITKYSSELYNNWFRKAEERLKEVDGENHYDEIQTLADYFEQLPLLVYGTQDPDAALNQSPRYEFLKLPLDEPHFIVDLNSREIKIPDVFRKNGVSVVGDEYAEMVFFEVDRFYDYTDLATQDIVIIWQAPGSNELRQTPAFNPFTVVQEDGEEKIIFGWGISSEMTKTSGRLSFAIRFCSEADFNEPSEYSLNYSLSTAMATVNINPGIIYDIKTLKEVDRVNKSIWQRIMHAITPGKPDDIEVAAPVFIYRYYDIDGTEAESNWEYSVNGMNNILDIDDDIQNKLILGAIATKGESYGSIGYAWYFKGNEQNAVEERLSDSSWEIPFLKESFIRTKIFNPALQYFVKKANNKYEAIIDPSEQDLANDGNDYYLCCSLYAIDKDKVKVGKYYPKARNELRQQYAENLAGTAPVWNILGATDPEPHLSYNSALEASEGYLKLDNGITLQAINIDNKQNPTYQWYFNNEKIENEIRPELALTANSKEGQYKVEVQNHRNNNDSNGVFSETKDILRETMQDYDYQISIDVNRELQQTKVTVNTTPTLSVYDTMEYKWSTPDGDTTIPDNYYVYSGIFEGSEIGYGVTITATKYFNGKQIGDSKSTLKRF